MQQWKAQGLKIVWVTLLVDDPNEGPPTAAGAKKWRDKFGLNSVHVVADPGFSMVTGSSVGTPMHTVVDPRTMKVTFKQEGFSGNYSALTSLAQQNQ
jgi:hypothetical protein